MSRFTIPTHNYLETDIVFNSNKSWGIYSGALINNVTDFQRVAVHELGHAIGLNHESNQISIMNPTISSIEKPQADDLNAVSQIYGVPKKYIHDFDGDGKSDVFWHDINSGANWIHLRDGGNVKLSSTVAPITDTTWDVAAIADINGDLKSDVLWRNTLTGKNWVWIMDGVTIS